MTPLQVLILSKDSSLFNIPGYPGIADTRARHLRYADYLQRRSPGSQIRVIVYTSRASRAKFDEVGPGLRIYGTTSLHRALCAPDMARVFRRVVQDGWKPTVVTAQTPWEEGVVARKLARRTGAKFIPQLHFDLFSRDWAKEHWLNPARKRIALRVLRGADTVRVVSQALRKNLSELGIVDDNRIEVVPVGVTFTAVRGDKQMFKRRVSERLADAKVVLFVGRLCAAKNLPLWIDMAGRVARADPAASFVIVGDGPQRTDLERWITQAGLKDRVFALGRKDHRQLPEIYAAADVFVLASHYEGFGRAVLEAYLSSVPVVSTKCTGPEDIIQDGESGFIVPLDDADTLAHRTLALLRDSQMAVRFGAAGEAYVTRHFTAEHLTGRLVDMWLQA